MKFFTNNHIVWLLSFFFMFSAQYSFAQDFEVLSETESYSQATYRIRFDGNYGEVTLRKEQGKVSILLKNKGGEVLGKAKVENDGNGNPLITIKEARPGTHQFWIFALDRIIPDNDGIALSPRQKAFLRCKDKCRDFVTSHPGFQALSLSNGTQTIPVATLATVKKALEAYQKCMWKCMMEARDRYQNR